MAVTYASDAEAIDAPPMGGGGSPRAGAPRGRSFQEALTGKAAELVKGVGHVTKGGRPLSDAEDGAQIFTKAHDTIMRTKAATMQGALDADSVIGGLAPEFASHPQFAAMAYRLQQDAQVRKAFTAGNQNLAGVPYGLVPSMGGFAG